MSNVQLQSLVLKVELLVFGYQLVIFCTVSLAFCQGLAFYLCVSALMIKRWNLLRLWRKTRFAHLSPPADSCVYRLRRSILALRARGLFLTDRAKPSLWQRLLSPQPQAPEHIHLKSPGGGGAVPFWRWRVCKAQKTPFFSIAVTHRPHIFYSCVSSHPKTHIFSFNLSLNAPWFKKLVFEKNNMYFTLVILQSSIEKTNIKYHPKTLLFCELLALTRWPHIFLYFSLTECQKSCSHPMTPHFLSLCSHRMPQPVGGRALHPYPLHIWLPPPPGLKSETIDIMSTTK